MYIGVGTLLVIVIIVFGVGKLGDVGGAIGKGVREFRKATDEDGKPKTDEQKIVTGDGKAS